MPDLMSLARRMVLLNREMYKRVDLAMEQFSFGAGGYPYLLAVHYNSGCTQQHIADRLRVDKAAATRALCRLEENGCIERRKLPDNKREIRVYSTDKTAQLVGEIEQIIEREMRIVLAPLDSGEQIALRAIMKKLVQLPG